MKKYMFVLPTLSKGGAERVVSILASELVAQGREATILIYHRADQEYPVDSRVKVRCLSGGDEADYEKIGKVTRLKLMRQAIREENPDYLLPFITHVCIQTWVARLLTKYDVTYTVRNNPAAEMLPKPLRVLRKYLIEHSKRTLVQNEEQKKYYQPSAWDHIHVLPNPILPEYLALPTHEATERKVIVLAGRLEKQKNFSLAIRAAQQMKQHRDDFEIRIYGEGSLRQTLQQEIDACALGDTVRLMGRVADMRTVYPETDIFVLSSDFEGMPNALMEAMASEVASVSTDCPTGPADIIESGENGLIVPMGDVGSMQKALEHLLENQEDRKRMAKVGRESIRARYLPAKIVQQLIGICER